MMRRHLLPAAAALAAAAACGPSGRGSTTQPTSPTEPGTAGPATWLASDGGPWRTPGIIRDVVALDGERALVVAGSRIAELSLTTGELRLGPVAKSVPSRLIRVHDRVLGFGQTGTTSTAFTIDLSSLTAAPLAWPDPPVAPTGGSWTVALDGDGTRLLTCAPDQWPTVRDAATLAPIRTFTSVRDCRLPRFVDRDQVMIGGPKPPARVLDIATGRPVEIGRKPLPTTVPGPGGRTLTVATGRYVFSDATHVLVAEHSVHARAPVWLVDGSAVVAIGGGGLVVVPAVAGQKVREVALAAGPRRIVAVPGTAQVVVQFGTYHLAAVDLLSGTVHGNRGVNLERIEAVVPMAGRVVSAADRVRVWRDGGLEAEGPARPKDIAAGPEGAVAVATFDGALLWDPASGQTVTMTEGAVASVIDHDPVSGRTLFDDGERLLLRENGDGPSIWFDGDADLFIEALDAATGRMGVNDENAFYVAHPDGDRMFGFVAPDCDEPLDLVLAPGRELAAVDQALGPVHLYDTEAGRALGGYEIADETPAAMTFVPGGDQLIMVTDQVVVLDTHGGTAVAWPLPDRAGIPATAVGVDHEGRELAVGFADGAILWARLDELRARAKPIKLIRHPPAALRCPDHRPVEQLDELRNHEEEEDEDHDEYEGDFGDEDEGDAGE